MYFSECKKQPMEMFYKKGVLKNLQNSQENTCVGVSFKKAAGLRPVTLPKKRL